MNAPRRYCTQPGCPVLVVRGRCPQHARALAQAQPGPHPHARLWYYSPRWHHLRLVVLRDAHYTCAHCGQIAQLLEIDHIIKHAGDPCRFWDRENLQALCPPCHGKKTQGGG